MDVRQPLARVILTTAAANGAGRHTVPLGEVVAALEELSRSPERPGGWVGTGAVADAIGVTVGEAAARLRVANRQPAWNAHYLRGSRASRRSRCGPRGR